MDDTSLLDIFNIIFDGGWVMIPLFLLGLIIYGQGLSMTLFFKKSDISGANQEDCEKSVENPDQAKGQIGEIVRYTQQDVNSLSDIQTRFDEVRLSEVPRIKQGIVVLSILVNAAPLLGLLGTVLGMLTTFQGISVGGSESTTDMVADGISVALITTQMGLFLAIPGYFLVYHVQQKKNHFEAVLVRLESMTLQHFNKKREIAE
jgi:biopolymer transport protein ExbB